MHNLFGGIIYLTRNETFTDQLYFCESIMNVVLTFRFYIREIFVYSFPLSNLLQSFVKTREETEQKDQSISLTQINLVLNVSLIN